MFEKELRRIGQYLFGGFKPADGVAAKRIQTAEKKLGFSLPWPLTTFYRMAGKNRAVCRSQNRILAPNDLYLKNGAMIFEEENQGVVFWGVLVEDIKQPDPPVQQGNPAEERWYPDAEHLSAFLLGTVCFQATFGLPHSGIGEVDDQLLNDLDRELTRVGAGMNDEINDLVAYCEKNLVVCLTKSGKKFSVGCRTEGCLQAFEDRFDTGLDWL